MKRRESTRQRQAAVVFAAIAVSVAFAVPSAGQTLGADGAAIYRTYCAACHGVEGLGNGPMAPTLRTAPPNLTLLSRRNGDTFPEARVRRIVDGREVESHGNREMPVWGDVFRMAPEGGSADAVSARITALVRYLESMQQRRAH